MTVDDMRAAILRVYPTVKWKQRVSRMYDVQVIAIYYSFCEKGKFDKPVKKQGSPAPKRCTQLNFFNLIKGE